MSLCKYLRCHTTACARRQQSKYAQYGASVQRQSGVKAPSNRIIQLLLADQASDALNFPPIPQQQEFFSISDALYWNSSNTHLSEAV